MEVLVASCSKEQLWFNFLALKESMRNVPLPMDYIAYECSCGKKVFQFHRGAEYFENTHKSIQLSLDESKVELMKEHQAADQCSNPLLAFKSNEFQPETLIMFLDEVEPSCLTNIILGDNLFEPRLIISLERPIFALYQKSQSCDQTYYNLIMDNFETYLQEETQVVVNEGQDLEPEIETNIVNECDKTIDDQQLNESFPESFYNNCCLG